MQLALREGTCARFPWFAVQLSGPCAPNNTPYHPEIGLRCRSVQPAPVGVFESPSPRLIRMSYNRSCEYTLSIQLTFCNHCGKLCHACLELAERVRVALRSFISPRRSIHHSFTKRALSVRDNSARRPRSLPYSFIPRSFALGKISTYLLSCPCALFHKKHRGWGGWRNENGP